MRRFRIIIFLMALGILAALLLPATLPFLANRLLLPSLTDQSGALMLRARVLQMTPYSLTMSLAAGAEDSPDLHVPALQLRYSPGQLLRGRIEQLILESPSLRLLMEDGRIGLPSIPSRRDGSTPPAMALPPLPLVVDSILLRDALLVIDHPANGTSEEFLVSGEVAPQVVSAGRFRHQLTGLTASLSNRRLGLQLTGTWQQQTDTISMTLAGTIERLANLPLQPPGGGALSGEVAITANGLYSLTERKLQQYTIELAADGVRLARGNLALTLGDDEAGKVTLNGNSRAGTVHVAGLRAEGPIAAGASLTGSYARGDGTLRFSGTIDGDNPLAGSTLQFTTAPSGDSCDLTLSGQALTVAASGHTLTASQYQLDSTIDLPLSSGASRHRLSLAGLALPEANLALEAANLTLQTTKSSAADQAPHFSGTFSTSAISHDLLPVAALNGNIAGTATSLTLHGDLQHARLDNLTVSIDGTLSAAGDGELSLLLPATQVDQTVLPPRLAERLPATTSFAATVGAEATVTFSRLVPTARLTLQVRDGQLAIPEQKLAVAAIETTLVFPDLPRLATSPSQTATIDTIALGKISLSSGKIRYMVENPTTLFIENSKFRWSGGNVESGSMRLHPGQETVTTTLYCDRLQFADLFRQFGISDTEGDGSLNGRLPLEISRKGVRFDDGFLFSTPGNSGIVRFTNNAMLRQGISDAGQSAYLDYSLQALENFSYNWTKLTFTSQGDNLRLTMQIDGKPSSPLPFGYRDGQLVASEQGPGIQHPIRLDVNFNLPLAEMFRYGQGFKNILENMQ